MFSNYCLIFITKILHLFLSFPIQYAIKDHAKNPYYFLDLVELLFFCFINLDKQSCRQHKVPSQNIYFNLENNNTNIMPDTTLIQLFLQQNIMNGIS